MSNITYIPISDSTPGALDSAQRSMNVFAQGQGWPSGIKHSSNYKEGTPGGPTLQSILSRLSNEDTLAVPSLQALGTLPSEIERNLLAIISSGAALYLLDIGRAEHSLVAIRSALAASKEIERQYLSTKEYVNQMAEQHAIELDEHAKAVVERLASTFGVKNLLKTSDQLEANNPIGQFIRTRREALSLTQEQLGALVNVSKSTIQRAESKGVAEDIGAILHALTDTPAIQQGINS